MKFPFSRRLCAALVVLPFVVQTATAADLDGCTLDETDFAPIVAPVLEGAWQVTNGPGVNVMQMGGQTMTMPLPPAGTRGAVILYRDGKPWVTVPPAGETELMLLAKDHPHPTVQVSGVELALDPDALGGGTGCAADDLMRVWFTATFPPMDGESGPMTGTMGLYVINENLMTGTMEIEGSADGATMTARRLVTFRRGS